MCVLNHRKQPQNHPGIIQQRLGRHRGAIIEIQGFSTICKKKHKISLVFGYRKKSQLYIPAPEGRAEIYYNNIFKIKLNKIRNDIIIYIPRAEGARKKLGPKSKYIYEMIYIYFARRRRAKIFGVFGPQNRPKFWILRVKPP